MIRRKRCSRQYSCNWSERVCLLFEVPGFGLNFVVVDVAAAVVNSINHLYVIETGRKYVQYMSVIDDRDA
jgi:phosphatidylserine decarboxylase